MQPERADSGARNLRNPVNTIDRHIGRRVRIRRELLRMSPTQAAARLGVSEAILAEYELGLLRIDARTLFRMVQLLGVKTRYFYEGVLAEAVVERPVPLRAND